MGKGGSFGNKYIPTIEIEQEKKVENILQIQKKTVLFLLDFFFY